VAKIFHELLTVEEALKRIKSRVRLKPLGAEIVGVAESLDRVIAEDVLAPADAPPFDRSEVDGYAVVAENLYGASEKEPVRLLVVGKSEVGSLPEVEVGSGECAEIATGAPLPRGSNSVVMVEYTKKVGEHVLVYRSVFPGENVSQAGSDYVMGDIVVRRGARVTSREVASLSALGIASVRVFRRPKVAVLSSGCELVEPGSPLGPGKIYDANGPAICSLVRECGGDPRFLGILPDSYEEVRGALSAALKEYDVVVTSGGTSAGARDVVYRAMDSVGKPGVIVHGLKLKPGKPTVVAVAEGKLLFGLPGFPLSAMMAFALIVRPVLLRLSGLEARGEPGVRATLPFRIVTGRGRRELVPVSLVGSPKGYRAYPLPGGPGSTSSLVHADGFIDVPWDVEFLEEGEEVSVRLLSDRIRPADITVIGSHCPGVDILLSLARLSAKVVNAGSMGGWIAVRRGEADAAGTHLLDEESGLYNTPFLERFGLKGRAVVVKGYLRRQGFIVARGNPKGIEGFQDLLRGDVRFINRNRGSGTRAIVDLGLRKVADELGVRFEELVRRIPGYTYEARTHSAVALAVLQGRADIGIGLEHYARLHGLDFKPISYEEYDFLIPKDRLRTPHVQRFLKVLKSPEFERALSKLYGHGVYDRTGEVVE